MPDNNINSEENGAKNNISGDENTNPDQPIKENDPEKAAEEPVPAIFNTDIKSRVKETNYQISLLSENLLRVQVITKKAVKIISTVKDTITNSETQSNEFYFYPLTEGNLQDAEILIAIDEDAAEKVDDKLPEEKDDSTVEVAPVVNEPKINSNFQINLINENLLKVRINTNKGVRIDSSAKDKKFTKQIQSNKIYVKPKLESEKQEVEIIIAITPEVRSTITDTSDSAEEVVKLVPNPEVMDLIKPPDYTDYGEDNFEPIPGYKNPFDALRKLIQKNLTIGIIAAVSLHFVAAAFAYYNIGKKQKDISPEEQARLIVIQDLPDPKIKLENIEDPNKPKVEVPPVEENPTEPNREITPRRVIRPPAVNRHRVETNEEETADTSSSSDINRELDSLRKLVDEIGEDTTGADTSTASYEIPDSLRNSFSENDIGLAMYFPKNWKLTDQREINKNETEFRGVVITDTTAEQPGTMTLFIFLDTENKDFSSEDFKTDFKMIDTTLTGFVKEPKTIAGFTEYKFYVFNKLGTEKLSLKAQVRKQFFDQYKNEIEAVVRSISIRKKEDL